LWYHGTLDWRVPTSDTEAPLTSSERTSWWVPYEAGGTNAGYLYSRWGGADRTSTDQPLGLTTSAIRDGYNQWWNLGAGVANNRIALPANNGTWPNVVKFNRTTTNAVEQGQSTALKFYYQWARPDTELATISLHLDTDFNPRNANETLLCEIPVPGNGASSISFATTNVLLAVSSTSAGTRAFFARITAGGRSRVLYAPELVQIIPVPLPPTLAITQLNALQFQIVMNGLPGQTLVLENSTDLFNWQPRATNTLAGSQWVYTNSTSATPAPQFFRAVRP
jgi:hypothetical protein